MNKGMSTLAVAVAALVSLGLLVGVIFGGWALGWWFKGQNVNRQAHIIRSGYANQQTLRDEITRKIGDTDTISVQLASPGLDAASTQALTTQKRAITSIVCRDAMQITGDPLPDSQQSWVELNCLNGQAR